MEQLDELLRNLNAGVPEADERGSWKAILQRTAENRQVILSFSQFKAAAVAALVLLTLNIGTWVWMDRAFLTVESDAVKGETYMQAFDFNLYQE